MDKDNNLSLKEPVMGMMGGKMFSKYSRSVSKDSEQQKSEPKAPRQQSPFMNNTGSTSEEEAPNVEETTGEMEKRILRKAAPGSLPDGVLGALSWKTNP